MGKALEIIIVSNLMLEYELLKPVIYTMEYINKAYELDDNPTIFERVDNIVINSQGYYFYSSKICYLNYKTSKNSKELTVIPSSLDQKRVHITKQLFKYINDLFIDGIRLTTINNRIKIIIRFFEYVNVNNIELDIEKSSIQKAIIHYTEYLNHKVKIYDKELKVGLTTTTAHNYQNWILSFFAYFLNIDSLELLKSSYMIVYNSSQRVGTQALSNEIIETEFSLYTYIFRRLSNIILEHEIFPLTFSLDKKVYWITSGGQIKHESCDILVKSGIYNYNEDRYYTIDEIVLSKRYKNASKRNGAIKTSKKKHDKANSPYSASRLLIASYACKAYFTHFLFVTGENDSTSSNILFNENFTIENSKLSFKSIKWRANGRTVEYDIQTEFIDDFKLYLRMRSYLLKYENKEHKDLFLCRSKNKLTTVPSYGEFSSQIRASFSLIFNKNNFTATSKTIRVTKGLWIRNTHGSSLSSYILQHSKKTSNSSYTSLNFEESSEELTNYFSELTNQLLDSPGIEKSTPSGKCIEPHVPEAISEIILSDTVTINCRDQTTCLFCSKYRIHADEKDIRKLLSMKYLIIQSEYLAASIEHFNRIYKLVLIHIEELLEKIRALGEEQVILIIDIHQQIFEQEKLSDYWYRKLELLDELGVL